MELVITSFRSMKGLVRSFKIRRNDINVVDEHI